MSLFVPPQRPAGRSFILPAQSSARANPVPIHSTSSRSLLQDSYVAQQTRGHGIPGWCIPLQIPAGTYTSQYIQAGTRTRTGFLFATSVALHQHGKPSSSSVWSTPRNFAIHHIHNLINSSATASAVIIPFSVINPLISSGGVIST